MARLAKCKRCGVELQPEERFVKSSKNYCKSCYDIVCQEAESYKQLIEIICQYYGIDAPTGLILKQVKEYKNDFKYTYSAMTYTLWYCKEVLGKQCLTQYGIALVKYHYEDAKDYYTQQEQRRQTVEELKDVEIKTKKIRRSNKAKEKNTKLIDLNSLSRDGGDN